MRTARPPRIFLNLITELDPRDLCRPLEAHNLTHAPETFVHSLGGVVRNLDQEEEVPIDHYWYAWHDAGHLKSPAVLEIEITYPEATELHWQVVIALMARSYK